MPRNWIRNQRHILFCMVVSVILSLSTLSGCALLYPPPEENFQARQILEKIDGVNAGLSRFKALADMRLESDSQIVSGRIGMAAVLPGKLRVEWMNILGQPITSIAADGHTITILSRIDHSVHRLRQSSTALEPLIQIPIGVEDLEKIVIGRLPLPEDAVVQIQDSAEDIDTYLLKDRWHNVLAKLRIDLVIPRIKAMTVFDRQGQYRYSIRWETWRNYKQYVLPSKIVFESEQGQRLIITTDRFWPDADVPDSIFNLEVPKG